ncbi:MAG: YigZ family protein [Muribaculaceae bacterium]|nr:YigZ family protein [Muribaculaceae bacterium]
MAKKKQVKGGAEPSQSPDSDIFLVPAKAGEGKLTEKMSRFLSFARPVASAEEAREFVKNLQNEYHDARHVCWAYILGEEGEEYQLNDNGEPSGTAGRPIHGQIRSAGLTNVCVAVVRYFGGIKLGTPGLIAAYKESARLALEDAGSKECCRQGSLWVEFPYEDMGIVMKLVKAMSLEVCGREIDNISRIGVRFPRSRGKEVRERLEKVGKVED